MAKAVILAIRLSVLYGAVRSSATNAGLLGIQKYSGRRRKSGINKRPPSHSTPQLLSVSAAAVKGKKTRRESILFPVPFLLSFSKVISVIGSVATLIHSFIGGFFATVILSSLISIGIRYDVVAELVSVLPSFPSEGERLWHAALRPRTRPSPLISPPPPPLPLLPK